MAARAADAAPGPGGPALSSLSDSTALLQQARGGSRGARERLLEKHAGRLRVYCDYRLGSALRRNVEPEDVVQEALLRAWRDFDGALLESNAAFSAWLTTIARRVIVDVARAARTAKRDGGRRHVESVAWSRSGSQGPAAGPAADAPGPRTLAQRSEIRGQLVEAFGALDPRQRRVIVLRHLEGLSARETAARLGCTEGAAHALFRRALVAWGTELERLQGP